MVQMNFSTRQKESLSCRKQTWLTRGEGEGGVNWEIETDMYMLLCIK